MVEDPTTAVSLLPTGLLLAAVVLAQLVVARHLPLETVPTVLRRRVSFAARVSPWLLLTAAAMVVVGLGQLLMG